jgi:hypothetical protein
MIVTSTEQGLSTVSNDELSKVSRKRKKHKLNRELVPIEFIAATSDEKALALYCSDLLLQCKTPAQTQQILLSVYPDEQFIEELVTAELKKLNDDKRGLFEQLVLRGLGLALEQKSLGQYFKGLALLKDSYGISRTIVTTIKEDRPQFLSTAFLDLKVED